METAFLVCAVIGGTFFVIQTLMLAIGGVDTDIDDVSDMDIGDVDISDLDTDVHADAVQAHDTFQLLMLEQMPQLSETAAKAISNIKFDMVVVWDTGNGKGSTTGFLQNMAGALPPMLHMMKDVGGVDIPEFFGKLVGLAEEAAKDEKTVVLQPKAKADGKAPTANTAVPSTVSSQKATPKNAPK